MAKSRHALDRRTFLRGSAHGVVASVALPALEVMLDAHGTAYADGSPIPPKLLVWFFGNGVHCHYGKQAHTERWVPQTTGPDWEPSELLEPLAADPEIKRYVNVVTGMNSKANAYAHNGHLTVLAGSAGALKDGALCRNSTPGTLCSSLGKTIDQIVADSVGRATRFRSLELACDHWYTSDGTVAIISQNGRGSVNWPERDPRRAFARLFGVQVAGGARDPMIDAHRSMLDGVLTGAGRLRARLGAADRRRLDEHLDNLRALEWRLAQPPGSCAAPALGSRVSDEELASAALDFTKLNQIWTELIGVALACDLTRVVSYMFTRPGSFSEFKEIGVHPIHQLSHNEAAPQAELGRGIAFTIAKLGESVRQLHRVKIGAGNLLDHLCMLATSELSRGWDHDQRDWPVLFIGRAGGALRHPGVHWRRVGDELDRVGYQGTPVHTVDRQGAPGDYRATTDDNLTRVPLTALWAMGCKQRSLGFGAGVATSPLGDILTIA